MKKFFILVLLSVLYSVTINAQVTTFGDSPASSFEFLPNEGSRVIQGFRVDMGSEKYSIVYSKGAKGVTPDKIYIEQYVKEGEEWKKIIATSRTSQNTIFIWGKRAGFFTDEVKNGVAYTAFSEEDLNTEQRFIVGYFILYKGKLYTLSENRDGEIKRSVEYENLPDAVKNRIEEAFSKLDKWTN